MYRRLILLVVLVLLAGLGSARIRTLPASANPVDSARAGTLHQLDPVVPEAGSPVVAVGMCPVWDGDTTHPNHFHQNDPSGPAGNCSAPYVADLTIPSSSLGVPASVTFTGVTAIERSIAVNGTLIVSSATVALSANAGISVNAGGSLNASSSTFDGTGWTGIAFQPPDASSNLAGAVGMLDSVKVLHAEGIFFYQRSAPAAVLMDGNASLTMTNSVIDGSKSFGLLIDGPFSSCGCDAPVDGPTLVNDSFTNSAEYGVFWDNAFIKTLIQDHDLVASGNGTAHGGLPQYNAFHIPRADGYRGNPAIKGKFQSGRVDSQGNVIAHLGIPIFAEGGSAIAAGASMTLYPASADPTVPTLLLALGTQISLASGSSGVPAATFTAQGTEGHPVIIKAADSSKPWVGMSFQPGTSGFIDHASIQDVDGQNGRSSQPAAIFVQGPGTALQITNSSIGPTLNGGGGIEMAGEGVGGVAPLVDNVKFTGVDAAYDIQVDDDTTFPTVKNSSFDKDIHIAPAGGQGLSNLTFTAGHAIHIGSQYGNILRDDTWSAAGAPFVLDSSINVYTPPAGTASRTLTINPGVTVQAAAGVGISVQQGTTLNIGANTGAQTVLTSTKAAPAAGYWGGIAFRPGSSGNLSNVRISYGGGGAFPDRLGNLTYAALVVDAAAPTIDHVIVDHSSGLGAEVIGGGRPTFSNDSFASIGGAYAIQVDEESILPILTSDSFYDNSSIRLSADGLGVLPDGQTARVQGLCFTAGSLSSGPCTSGSTPSTGSLHLLNFGYPIAQTVTLANFHVPYVADGSLTVGAGTTLTIAAGVTVQVASGSGIFVEQGATLNIGANTGAQTALTSAKAAPAAGDWGGIAFLPGSSGNLSNVHISYAGSGLYAYRLFNDAHAALVVDAAAPTIDHVSIDQSSGSDVLVIGAGTPVMHNDKFGAVPAGAYGVFNDQGANGPAVDATNNAWLLPDGTTATDGPGGVGPGHGAPVSPGVTYDPWTGKVGGTISGTVYHDSATAGNELAGASVYACPPNVSVTVPCNLVKATPANGQYSFSGLAAGAYDLHVNVPGNTTLSFEQASVTLSGNETKTQHFILVTPQAPPAGTSVVSDGKSSTNVPFAYWDKPVTLTTQTCSGVTVGFQLLVAGTTVVQQGAMTEGPSGTYTATLQPLKPNYGRFHVVITSSCTGSVVNFDLYIDPSGIVQDQNGKPVAGATVTLLTLTNADGTHNAGASPSPVPNGSTIMDPSNRVNPDSSRADGHFGWNVIPGFYQVTASKASCTTTAGSTSATLTIPPPALNLVLTLNCPLLGDVNLDGHVTAVDALCVLRHVAGLVKTATCNVDPTGETDAIWHASHSGTTINAVDALC
ncbi:MAG: hypothetical protein ACR2PL_03935, partial [Dehalococcoidia bacterium]